MAIKDVKSKPYEMFIGLVKNKNFIYISSFSEYKSKDRKDVTKYFKKEDGFYDISGFQIKINSNLLEKGTYNLCMILKNEEEILVKKTNKFVEIN